MKELKYDFVNGRIRTVIRLNGMEMLVDPGAEISISTFSKNYFYKHYKVLGERRNENVKGCNSPMPGTILILDEFVIGELKIIGMPILIPDGYTYFRTPILLGSDLFKYCNIDCLISYSTDQVIMYIHDDNTTRKYTLL